MKKMPTIILFLFVVFISLNFAQNQSADQTNSEEIESEEIINSDSSDEDSDETFSCGLPASVIDLQLSQKEIILICQATDKSCSSNKIINIATVAQESDEYIKYVYSITAGKIIGEGANVEWDLSDVKPGTYVITAGISQPSVFGEDGWAVFGTTQTRTVIVKECPECK